MGTYSRGTYVTLPTDDGDLTTVMSAGEVSDVATINNVFVGQNLSGQIAAEMFKNTCSASLANLLWVGQSDLAPSISPITLEAYNYSTAAWVGQATNAAVATNVTCTLAVTLGTTQYISPGGYTTGRVYQSAATESLMASYETSFDDYTNIFNDSSKYGQTFLSNGKSITKVKLAFNPDAALTGTIYVELYATTGSPAVPTGDPIGTSTGTFDVSTLTPSQLNWVTFTFSTPVETTSTTYGVAVRVASGISGGNLRWYTNTGGYADGTGFYNDAGTWVALATIDHYFEVWGQ